MPTLHIELGYALKNYIALLSSEEYFDAHEVLEAVWHPLRLCDHPLKNLVKGLINAAIAFEHLKRDRIDASIRARKVITAYERYRDLSQQGIVNYELFEDAIQKVETIKQACRVFK